MNAPPITLLATESVIALEDTLKIPSLSWPQLAAYSVPIIHISQDRMELVQDTQPLLEFVHRLAGFPSEMALQRSMDRCIPPRSRLCWSMKDQSWLESMPTLHLLNTLAESTQVAHQMLPTSSTTQSYLSAMMILPAAGSSRISGEQIGESQDTSDFLTLLIVA